MLRVAAGLLESAPGTVQFYVATVDHGLRRQAEAEARFVAARAADCGLPHDTLRWRGWQGRGNLQAEARDARYRLLAAHAAAIGASAVLTAHHADDQIETHLLARARGEGGSALAGMRPCRDLAPGLRLLRPFLHLSGDGLRRALDRSGWRPVLDPSNRDPRFARARLRANPLDPSERASVAAAIARRAAERAEEDAALRAALDAVEARTDDLGRVRLSAEGLAGRPPELAARLVARVATAAGGARHAPERVAAFRLASELRGGRSEAATLNGAQFRRRGDVWIACREWGRTGPAELRGEPGEVRLLFDNRFDIRLTNDEARDGALVVPFGRLGRGSEAERTLPVLLDPSGEARLVHPGAAGKAGPVSGLLDATCRVGWRLCADLATPDGSAAVLPSG
ncbi:tRNA lysidine(34) synthetase TilS [Antarcticirhabdus aurantiaca]|uniref:tRNA lysidine(34) synthetase TilS n=2 Tax=Antarcticirhabdus aurantiaca TaxID=2606717 RepID=A0ACD4NJR3_9HYPH|nr:tRNA lysidine(34) synthetase TilS [Jeongeuplla avenae]